MNSLRDLDEVAYVRFASVYRRFKDADDFVETIRGLPGRDGSESAGSPPASPDNVDSGDEKESAS
jgi:transcriptional repressor NrdR